MKPGFFKNEDLAALGPYAQMLFAGLWCLADREGRLEDRPLRIKAEIFPYYEPKPNIITLLDKLNTLNFIQRFDVENEHFIQILQFRKHQNPHPHEAASIIPNPPILENTNNNDVMACNDNVRTSRDSGGKCNADIMNPYSLNPDTSLFDIFWKAYPKKKSKGQAEKAWKSIKPTPELSERIIISVKTHKNSADWKRENGKYIPYPATFLNAKGWEDEVDEGGEFNDPYKDFEVIGPK